MEATLDRLMEEVLQHPEVKGVMFTDDKGLCVGSKGSCSSLTSGGISRVAEVAARLDPDGKKPTMIQMDGGSIQLLIQQRHSLTGTVLRTVSADPIV